jgi:diguanylate cyclase (GGDEF)-like protein
VDKHSSQIMFSWFILASIILCASDFTWGLIDISNAWSVSSDTAFAVNSIYYTFVGVVAYLWFLFSESEQESKIATTKLGIILSTIPIIIFVILVVGSYRYQWLFYIDENNCYQRGDYYILKIAIGFFYILFTSIKSLIRGLKKSNYLNRSKYLSLASFAVFPCITAILQILFKGSPMISVGVSFAAMQVYISTREALISADPFTKLNNKNELIRHLDFKIKTRNPNRDLYLFIMDLDYFKTINDKYGHLEGDDAILISADSLRLVAKKFNFFVSRYGGDEFVMVGEVHRDFNHIAFITEVNEILQSEAEKRDKPYKLHMSIGYASYNYEMKTIPDFIKAADELLYDTKKARIYINK